MKVSKEIGYLKYYCRGKSERTIVNNYYKKYKKKYGLSMETTDVFEVLDANGNAVASMCLIIIFSAKPEKLNKLDNKIRDKVDTAHDIEQNFVNFLQEYLTP